VSSFGIGSNSEQGSPLTGKVPVALVGTGFSTCFSVSVAELLSQEFKHTKSNKRLVKYFKVLYIISL
jgi:hypothetical protein